MSTTKQANETIKAQGFLEGQLNSTRKSYIFKLYIDELRHPPRVLQVTRAMESDSPLRDVAERGSPKTSGYSSCGWAVSS